MTTPYQHEPVMAKEVLEFLNPAAGCVFIDATLGGGGHAEKLINLNSKVKVYAFDQDIDAIKAARPRLKDYAGIELIRDNFVNLKKRVGTEVDGILFDLGVSSYQLDEAARGFSLQKEGPLDMRMDKNRELTAQEIVNNYPRDELTRIFCEYGEERFAKRISHAICLARNSKIENLKSKPIETTFQLKEIIERAIPTWKKRESVTRIFQALRIAVNHELDNLQKALADAIELLKPGGRLVVISYHSLEDRLVKTAFRQGAKDGQLRLLAKKPLRPQAAEISANPRARSAKLRAAQKL